jgi:hypothetical protein
MKTNQKKDGSEMNEILSENLDVQGLLEVKGGVDNDEDWCAYQQCSSTAQKTCYTGA